MKKKIFQWVDESQTCTMIYIDISSKLHQRPKYLKELLSSLKDLTVNKDLHGINYTYSDIMHIKMNIMLPYCLMVNKVQT